MRHRSALSLLAALFALLALAAACHVRGDDVTGPTGFIPSDLASCGTSKALFTTPPIEIANVQAVVPLGSLNPPGHTFPTDHQYIYLPSNASSQPVSLYAPGNVTIVGARKVHYSTNADDYALDFMPCREVYADFGHVRSITPSLLARLGAFDQQCSTYSPDPATTVTACYTKPLDVRVNAGEVIGTAAGLDLSLFDSRVAPLVYANASRWVTSGGGFDHFHVVPFSDYFAEPASAMVRAKLGTFDGRKRRTIEPLGGTIATDIAGTAQGTWFNPAQPTYPETPHLTIVPDNVDPTEIDVSIGLSQPGMSSGAYTVLPPSGGGAITPPSQISPGGPIACWEIGYSFTSIDRRGVVLVQLLDASTLRVEARPGATRTCAAEAPLAFTSAAFTYKR
jgi:hypothetical protein